MSRRCIKIRSLIAFPFGTEKVEYKRDHDKTIEIIIGAIDSVNASNGTSSYCWSSENNLSITRTIQTTATKTNASECATTNNEADNESIRTIKVAIVFR